MLAQSGVTAAGCLFCQIVAGELPAHVVIDEPAVMGFLDIRPLFPGHVLIVPKLHVETLADLPAALVEPLFATTRRVAAAVEQAMGADGSFVAVNNRVSQSVPHLHVHVVPRRRKDGLRGFMWPRQRYADDDAMAAAASALREALASEEGLAT
jgi:histidine triad (HIT) family protein